jgi:hypothetical protein
MRLILSNPTRRRLRERALGESDIEAILRRSQKPERDPEGNQIYRGIIDGMIVTVIVRKASQPLYVITDWDDVYAAT